jgi:hypothetical protein
MIGQIISHYKILEKPRHKDGGQVGEGGPALWSPITISRIPQ